MQHYLRNTPISLFSLALALSAIGLLSSDASAQGLNVSIGSATVDMAANTGTVSASIDIAIENPTAGPLPIAGYTFFLDIEPIGMALPTGITFDTPAATFSSGNGAGLLAGANIDGIVNPNPAEGDLGLSQLQLFDASVLGGASELLLTVNLLIDLETVVAGEYAVALSSAGQNSISSIGNSDQAFTSTPGALTIEASNQVILGDVDLSGVVDFADIPAFIQVLSSGGFQAEADIDQNGVVDFSDIGPFITILTGA